MITALERLSSIWLVAWTSVVSFLHDLMYPSGTLKNGPTICFHTDSLGKLQVSCIKWLWIYSKFISILSSYVVMTTSAGIMDHEEAKRKHVGGKILGFFFWNCCWTPWNMMGNTHCQMINIVFAYLTTEPINTPLWVLWWWECSKLQRWMLGSVVRYCSVSFISLSIIILVLLLTI